MALHLVRVSAPGKVILHGEHSVMFGKTAIAASLGLRSKICVQEEITECPSLDLQLRSLDLDVKIPMTVIKTSLLKSNESATWTQPHKLDHETHMKKVEKSLEKVITQFHNLKNNQQNALRGVFYLLSGILSDKIQLERSLKITIQSELTIGAGTGSSASYAVCLAGAFIQLAKLKGGEASDNFSTEDKKLISAWAYNCEKIMHGAPSGIDNSTATFGSLVSFRKGEEPHLLECNKDLRILLVNTRVSRETKALTAKVAALQQRNGDAVACIMDAIGLVTNSAVAILKNLSNTTHNDVAKQYENLAELWEMNHCLLASLGVSHPALENIRASARKHGLACKLTGAGGGGYAIILITPLTQQSTIKALSDELVDKGFGVNDTQLGGLGVALDI